MTPEEYEKQLTRGLQGFQEALAIIVGAGDLQALEALSEATLKSIAIARQLIETKKEDHPAN